MEEATNARLASVSTVEWLIFLRTKRKERRLGKIWLLYKPKLRVNRLRVIRIRKVCESMRFDSGPEVFVRVNRNYVLTEYVLNENDCITFSLMRFRSLSTRLVHCLSSLVFVFTLNIRKSGFFYNFFWVQTIHKLPPSSPTCQTSGRTERFVRKTLSGDNALLQSHTVQQEIFVSEKFRQKRPSGSSSGIYCRQTSVVACCSSVVRSSLCCLSFIFTFMNISDPTLVVLWKTLVRNLI